MNIPSKKYKVHTILGLKTEVHLPIADNTNPIVKSVLDKYYSHYPPTQRQSSCAVVLTAMT